MGKPKTDAGIRDVTVPPHVADMLREIWLTHTGSSPESFLFTTGKWRGKSGQRLTKGAFTLTVKKGFASVGKPDMRVHDLRHIGATYGRQGGRDHQRANGAYRPHLAGNGDAVPDCRC